MNKSTETKAQDLHLQVNEQRRRFAKGGLAAPIVLGTLLSRPVLGAAPYNCTLSGQLSGNTSSHGKPVSCSSSGSAPSYYAGLTPSSWPDAAVDFLDGNDEPLLFRLTPGSKPVKFYDAFQRKITPGQSTPTYEDATVWDVLKGFPVMSNTNNGNPLPNAILEVKSGVNASIGLELGKEAVAAYMNAFNQTKFPITQEKVVAMFNAVIRGGIYDPLGLNWDASNVLSYFKSLHL